MADGMNKAILIGHVGQDPELKRLESGSVLNVRLATTTSYPGRDGQRQEVTDWHTVVIWNKRAEALAKILHKGSQIYVEGRITTRSYEKNGEKHYATNIQASQIKLMGGKREDGGSSGGGGGGTRSSGSSRGGGGSAPKDSYDDQPMGDEELPF